MTLTKTHPLAPIACAALLGLLAAGCEEAPHGTIRLVVDGERTIWDAPPAPTRLGVFLRNDDGSVEQVAETTLPAKSLSLGDLDPLRIVAFEVHAADEAGIVRVKGRSVRIALGSLEGMELPLFVSRVDDPSRLPDSVGSADPLQLAADDGSRYLTIVRRSADGQTLLSAYDFAYYKSVSRDVVLSAPVQSLVPVSGALLAIADDGARWIGQKDARSQTVEWPAGESPASVAGGSAVHDPDGNAWIVGATRMDAASDRVARANINGSIDVFRTSHLRKGAAATWVERVGLVIVGGSSSAPAVEALDPEGNQRPQTSYAPLDRAGHAAVTVRASHVVVVGGTPGSGSAAESLELDPSCTGACTASAPGDWPSVQSSTAQAIPYGEKGYALVFHRADSDDLLATVQNDTLRELAPRTPRRGATLASTPTGGVAIVGGGDGIDFVMP